MYFITQKEVFFYVQIRICTSKYKRAERGQAEGIKAAKARGVKFGRPKKELPENFEEIMEKWENKEITAKKAAELCGMAYSSFRKKVKEYKKC